MEHSGKIKKDFLKKDSNPDIFFGAVDIIQEQELKDKLTSGKSLRIKAGFDPSRPDLHIGHLALLKKLRWFQDKGHQVIFVVGDFTAQIGDPSGANQTRPVLTKEEVKENARTYANQAYKILDKEQAQIVYNSKWLGSLSSLDLVQLSSCVTVARMLERNDFSSRFKEQKPIGIHEFLYPLLQGYDSLELKSDVEMGGTDQIFNLLMGREIQKQHGVEPQCVLTFPLIEGIDGVKKMSKTYNNAIAFNDSPQEIFGKTMKISDELMLDYYKVFLFCLTSSDQDLKFKEKSKCVFEFFEDLTFYFENSSVPKIQDLSVLAGDFLKGSQFSPGSVAHTSFDSSASLKEVLKDKLKKADSSLKMLKENLASYFVETLYDLLVAQEAQQEFNKIFKKNLISDSIQEVRVLEEEDVLLSSLMKRVNLSSSSGEARRSILGGGLKLLESYQISDDRLKKCIGKKIEDSQLKINLKKGDDFILSIGKRKQVRIKVGDKK